MRLNINYSAGEVLHAIFNDVMLTNLVMSQMNVPKYYTAEKQHSKGIRQHIASNPYDEGFILKRKTLLLLRMRSTEINHTLKYSLLENQFPDHVYFASLLKSKNGERTLE